VGRPLPRRGRGTGPAAAVSAPEPAFAAWIADPRHDLAPVAAPGRLYLIACEPRTGSNLLCALLEQTGRAGRPSEYLHREAMPAAMARLGLTDPDAYLDHLMRRRTTPNGAFGLKAHYSQIEPFLALSRRGLPPGLAVIRLMRRDLVAQAVSFYLALRSGEWVGRGEGGSGTAVAYDFQLIRRAAAMILSQRVGWARTLPRLGGAAMQLAYEDLAADPDAACHTVLARLGLAGTAPAPAPRALPRRQGTARNAEWAARFRAEAAAQGVTLP